MSWLLVMFNNSFEAVRTYNVVTVYLITAWKRLGKKLWTICELCGYFFSVDSAVKLLPVVCSFIDRKLLVFVICPGTVVWGALKILQISHKEKSRKIIFKPLEYAKLSKQIVYSHLRPFFTDSCCNENKIWQKLDTNDLFTKINPGERCLVRRQFLPKWEILKR